MKASTDRCPRYSRFANSPLRNSFSVGYLLIWNFCATSAKKDGDPLINIEIGDKTVSLLWRSQSTEANLIFDGSCNEKNVSSIRFPKNKTLCLRQTYSMPLRILASTFDWTDTIRRENWRRLLLRWLEYKRNHNHKPFQQWISETLTDCTIEIIII